MTKINYTTAFSVLCVAAACSSPPSNDDAVADITRATHEWVAAYEAEDVARAISFVTDDAVLVPPNERIVTGVEAIEAWSQHMFESITVEEANTTVQDVRVAGDWAVSHGEWRMTMSVGGATVSDTSRYVLVWEQQADGAWKVAYDIWNSVLPMAASR
jgi:uncharacterized protein (TIGR02246 family)